MERIFCLLLLLLLPGMILADPGDLDTSFGQGGIAVKSLGREYKTTDMALLPNGKIVVAGRACPQRPCGFLLARYNPDGTPDLQFGHRGFVIRAFPGTDNVDPAVAVDRKGRILLAATLLYSGRSAGAILRYNPNGTPDSTFSTHGRFIFERESQFNDVLVLPDQKIVATGVGGRYDDDVLLVMLTASGRLDRRFGGGGFVTANRQDDTGRSIAIDSLGRIIVGGDTGINTYSGRNSYDFMLLRYKTDGRLDQSFGRRGRAIIEVSDYSDSLRKVVTLPGNNILATGPILSFSAGAVVKVLSNGRRSRQFGRHGVAQLPEVRDFDSNDLAMQSDGRIVVCGNGNAISETVSQAAAVFRYLPDGRLDSSFDRDGARLVTFGRGRSSSAACAITSDDRLVVAGTVALGNKSGIALARLLLQK